MELDALYRHIPTVDTYTWVYVTQMIVQRYLSTLTKGCLKVGEWYDCDFSWIMGRDF